MIAPARHAADVDPSQLSAQQRRAMRVAKEQKLYRRAGGFGRPPFTVSLDVAKSLIGLGLCRQDYSAGDPQLVLTGVGASVQAVIEQRAKARRH